MTLETEEEVQSDENKVSDYGVFLFCFFLQIVSHSRSQDGTWLNPENLRQILSGLEACATGQYPCGFVCLPTTCPGEGDEVDPISLFRFCCFVFSSWWCPISWCCSSPTVSCSVLCLKCNLPQNATHVGISSPCIVIVLNFIYLWILLGAL